MPSMTVQNINRFCDSAEIHHEISMKVETYQIHVNSNCSPFHHSQASQIKTAIFFMSIL